MMEKYLINKTWLIEYNRIKLRIRIMGVPKLINNKKEINI